MIEEYGCNFTHVQTIGVHTGFAPDIKLNIGTLITEKILDDFIVPTLRIYNQKYGEETIEL